MRNDNLLQTIKILRNYFVFLFITCIALLGGSCNGDLCLENDLYDDGECQDYCLEPDPDCEDDITTTSSIDDGDNDMCEELGKYDDGWCDDDCPKPDPDCDTPPPPTTTTSQERRRTTTTVGNQGDYCCCCFGFEEKRMSCSDRQCTETALCDADEQAQCSNSTRYDSIEECLEAGPRRAACESQSTTTAEVQPSTTTTGPQEEECFPFLLCSDVICESANEPCDLTCYEMPVLWSHAYSTNPAEQACEELGMYALPMPDPNSINYCDVLYVGGACMCNTSCDEFCERVSAETLWRCVTEATK